MRLNALKTHTKYKLHQNTAAEMSIKINQNQLVRISPGRMLQTEKLVSSKQ